jgi:hypothetical protein
MPYPAALDLIDEIDRTGMPPPLHEGAFTAFCHLPGELHDELGEAGLEVTDLVSVEGPAFILGDLDARFHAQCDRARRSGLDRRDPGRVVLQYCLEHGLHPSSMRCQRGPVSATRTGT